LVVGACRRLKHEYDSPERRPDLTAETAEFRELLSDSLCVLSVLSGETDLFAEESSTVAVPMVAELTAGRI
jgi:hypothetical protein